MFALLKKIFLISFFGVMVFSASADTSSSGPLNGNVKEYLVSYYLLLDNVYIGDETHRLKVGDSTLSVGNPAIKHMMEVIIMINRGLLDELYSTACIPQATATSTLYCGKDISLYNHVEIVSQTAGAVLIGTAGNDLLVADTVGGSNIIGNAGDDCLIGGNAGDQIIGGAGHDTCSNDVGDSTSSCETFL
jgi:Ca2+-binding RTX toxin-like protein